jgi:hypothetical protein
MTYSIIAMVLNYFVLFVSFRYFLLLCQFFSLAKIIVSLQSKTSETNPLFLAFFFAPLCFKAKQAAHPTFTAGFTFRTITQFTQ